MPIKCNLVERTSKDGNKYVCLVIYITENVQKIVFLTQAEKELLQLSNQKRS